MTKKLYIAPNVKVRAIETEGMICNSDQDSFTVTPSNANPITNGAVDSKPNYFGSYNPWGTDEDEED